MPASRSAPTAPSNTSAITDTLKEYDDFLSMATPPDLRHRPQLYLRPAWIFELDKADTLLVLKALGGRLTEAEKPAAVELGDRLTELRAQEGRQYLSSLERAEESMLRAQQGS